MVLMYLRSKHHQNELQNTIPKETQIENLEASTLSCDSQTKNCLRAIAMILLISTYVQIICKVYLIKDGNSEFSQSALIVGSLAGIILSKCTFATKKKNQRES